MSHAAHEITITEKTRTTRPRNAGAGPESFERTEWECSCGAAGCTIWNGPLLRRIERKGLTREQHIEQVSTMHIA